MPDVHQTQVGEVRIVALSRISPGPDFNPQTARDPERQRATTSASRPWPTSRRSTAATASRATDCAMQLEAPTQTKPDAEDASDDPAAQAA